jgi:hypothetical protein
MVLQRFLSITQARELDAWPEERPGEVPWPNADANGPATAANMKQSPAQDDREAIIAFIVMGDMLTRIG